MFGNAPNAATKIVFQRIIFLLNRKIILAFPLMMTIPVMIPMMDSSEDCSDDFFNRRIFLCFV